MKKIILILLSLVLGISLVSCNDTEIDVPEGDEVKKITINGTEITKDFDTFELQKLVFENFKVATSEDASCENYKYLESTEGVTSGAVLKTKSEYHLIDANLKYEEVDSNFIYYKDYLEKGNYEVLIPLDNYESSIEYKSFVPSDTTNHSSLYYIDYYFNDEAKEVEEKGYSKSNESFKALDNVNLENKPIIENYGLGKTTDLGTLDIDSNLYTVKFKLTEKFIIFTYKYLFDFEEAASDFSTFDFNLSNEDGEYLYETYYFDYNTLTLKGYNKESLTLTHDEEYETINRTYKKEYGRVFEGILASSSLESFLVHEGEESYKYSEKENNSDSLE